MCIKLIALHQPAGGDLRFIITAMKIVTDLERIGDQAVNIAQRVLELNREPEPTPSVDLSRMADCAERMVQRSLDAFVARDAALARQVCGEDAEVDAVKEQLFREMLAFIMEQPRATPRAVRLILISRFSSGSPTTPPISRRWSCTWSRVRWCGTRWREG